MARYCAALSILLVFVLGETFACPNECTCSETEVTCINLGTLPAASELFTDRSKVVTVSITGSSLITEIPEDFFVDMPKLTTINPSVILSCRQQLIGKLRGLAEVIGLVKLSLTNNSLTSLNKLSFKYLPMLSEIDISGNPIDCDGSDNDWIKAWLAAVASSSLIGTCSDGSEFTEYTDYIDDIVPVSLTFDSEDYTIDEGETQTITVSRDAETSTVLNARAMAELTSASEDDFIINDEQLMFPAGESSVTFELTIPDNSVKDPEGWSVTLKLVPESIIVRSSSAVVNLVDNDPNATVPTVKLSTQASEETSTNAPGKGEQSGSTAMPTTKPSSGQGSKAWIIILILIVLALAIIIGVFIWKKKQDRTRTTASPGQGDYSAVQGEGDGKVYSATTEELA